MVSHSKPFFHPSLPSPQISYAAGHNDLNLAPFSSQSRFGDMAFLSILGHFLSFLTFLWHFGHFWAF
jgi:hypothetical protein